MSRVARLAAIRVKPGRIDDARARWKEIKAGAEVADINVLHCTTGGEITDTYLVSLVYPDPTSMVKSLSEHSADLEALSRSAHDADSPYESIHTSNWTVISD